LASTADAVDGCLQAAIYWTIRKLTLVDARFRCIAELQPAPKLTFNLNGHPAKTE
jgi:hypothetical protein